MHGKSHTCGLKIFTDFSSPKLSEDNAVSFRTQLLFVIALQTALRLSEIYLLRLSQVSKGVHNDVKCIRVKGRRDSIDATSEAAQGGWKDSKLKQKDVKIYDKTVVSMSISIYKPEASVSCYATLKKDLSLYYSLSIAADNNDRFFASFSHQSNCEMALYKPCYL